MLQSYKTDTPQTPPDGRASLYFTEADELRKIDSVGDTYPVATPFLKPIIGAGIVTLGGTPSIAMQLYSETAVTHTIVRSSTGIFVLDLNEPAYDGTIGITDGIMAILHPAQSVWTLGSLSILNVVAEADGVGSSVKLYSYDIYMDATNPALVDVATQWVYEVYLIPDQWA